MTLAAGTRLGVYEITGQLGVGGMGEVYRANDTKLGREVAIKTLPSQLAQDPDRLARFEREAKLLAALNHPQIASIYGLDDHDGKQFLSMELVEGETLEQRLKAGPLPIEDALRLALQIAEALEAAHGKGVVHRDLKPANIMVTPQDQVKILDFGLAKAFSGDPNEATPANSPALSLAMTQAGLILGTAGYMSPEQASGQATDQRADIWAFGVVLYEMLTGLPLFSGESVPHILAAVLQTEPDWNRLPKRLHPRLKLLLERCLEKKVRNRYHSIADARIDVENVLSDPQGATTPPVTGIAVPARSLAARLTIAAALVAAGAAVAGLTAWNLWPSPEPRPVRRFADTLPADQVPNSPVGAFTLAADGRRFLYVTFGDEFYLHDMNELEARLIHEGEASGEPFFAPDGRSIGYFTAKKSIKRIADSGGASVPLGNWNGAVPLGASWQPDGTILYAEAGGIYRLPENGGTAVSVVAAEDGETLYGPTLLPDGDSLLFSAATANVWDAGQIVVQSLATGERKILLTGGNDAHYVPTGHIVYAFEDGLFGVAFDLKTLSVTGAPVPLVQGIARASLSPAANYGISDDGTLAYVTGAGAAGLRTVVWMSRDGSEEALLTEPRGYEQPRLSPDGGRLAFSANENGTATDVWTYDLARGVPTRLTFNPGVDSFPVWTPDGRRIAFWSDRDGGGLFWQAADGTGQAERLTTGDGRAMQIPTAFSPDGTRLIYYTQGGGIPSDVYVLSMDGEREAKLLIGTEFDEDFSDISPDGRWLAYSSDESGQDEVYVRPFPNIDDGKWQVSTDFGIDPVWGHEGHELYYRTRSRMMVADFEDEPTFTPGAPKALFAVAAAALTGRSSYDVAPDGQRFVLYREGGATGPTQQIVVVENWFEELKRLVPTQ